MNIGTLVRDYRDSLCTLGILTVGSLQLETLERTWVHSDLNVCGAKGVSCIPAGTYRLERHDSEAHPSTWALVNHELGVYHWDADIPPTCALGRTVVLIHPANYPEELRACIAPGRARHHDPARGWWIGQSRDAMEALHLMLNGQSDLSLTIVEASSCQPSSI